MAKESVRRCIVCGKRSPKPKLLRVVSRESGLLWDREQREPGRGAYVHPDPACCSRMADPGKWKHALKVEVSRETLAQVAGEISKVVMGGKPTESSSPQGKVPRKGMGPKRFF